MPTWDMLFGDILLLFWLHVLKHFGIPKCTNLTPTIANGSTTWTYQKRQNGGPFQHTEKCRIEPPNGDPVEMTKFGYFYGVPSGLLRPTGGPVEITKFCNFYGPPSGGTFVTAPVGPGSASRNHRFDLIRRYTLQGESANFK